MITSSIADLAATGDRALVVNAAPYAVPRAAALGAGSAPTDDTTATVSREPDDHGGFVLDNGLIRVLVEADGLLASVLGLEPGGREVLAPGIRGALLQLHRDTCTQWDAWDIVEHYRRHTHRPVAADSVELVTGNGPRPAACAHATGPRARKGHTGSSGVTPQRHRGRNGRLQGTIGPWAVSS